MVSPIQQPYLFYAGFQSNLILYNDTALPALYVEHPVIIFDALPDYFILG